MVPQYALALKWPMLCFGTIDGARQSGNSWPTPLELQSLTNSEPASKSATLDSIIDLIFKWPLLCFGMIDRAWQSGKSYIHQVLGSCGFYWCVFHLCTISKHPLNIWFVRNPSLVRTVMKAISTNENNEHQ